MSFNPLKNINLDAFHWLTLFVASILLMFVFVQGCHSKKVEQQLSNQEIVNDTLTKYRNKYNQEVSEKQVIVSGVAGLRKLNSTKDSLLAELQKIVNHKTVSATVITNSTHETGTTGTTIVSHETSTETHTNSNGNTTTIIHDFPVYQTEWSTQWSKGIITASKDTIKRDITMFNEFDIAQQYKRTGFLHLKKELNISITNKNPNTETLDAQSFLVSPSKSHKGFWFVAGAGVSAVASFLLLK